MYECLPILSHSIQVKNALFDYTGYPPSCQKLVAEGGEKLLDDDPFDPAKMVQVNLFITNEDFLRDSATKSTLEVYFCIHLAMLSSYLFSN